MSRLAAQKEFIFMKALGEAGFTVPQAIAQSRHTIVMSLVDGVPLRSVRRVGDPAGLYAELIEIIIRLAGVGLIHGDFNEFNIMVRDEDMVDDEEATATTDSKTEREEAQEEGDTDAKATARIKPVVIDFPQMVSIDHANAEMYFDRDVNCIKAFFKRRFHFTSEQPGPFFADARKKAGGPGSKRLDVEAEASGFSKKMAKELENNMNGVGADGDGPQGEEYFVEEQDSDDSEDSNDSNDSTVHAATCTSRDEGSSLETVQKETSNITIPAISTCSIDKG